jgi:hypothetical protein
MIKNEPSRDLKAELKAFLLPLREDLSYLFPRLPKEEKELGEHLRKLLNRDLASSEDNIVDWLVGLEAGIQNSNCGSEYCSFLGSSLARALINYVEQFDFVVGQGGPSEEVVNACKQCLVATFEKILGTSPTPNAPETKKTEQQQSKSLQRFEAAFSLLLDVADLVRETSVFNQEVILILTRTAELLNFSPQNTELDRQRLESEEDFFEIVAGKIIPYMMGEKVIDWKDETMNYPKKLKEYLEQLTLLRPRTGLLIEKFLAVLNQRNGIDNLYGALQTQAPGSQ